MTVVEHREQLLSALAPRYRDFVRHWCVDGHDLRALGVLADQMEEAEGPSAVTARLRGYPQVVARLEDGDPMPPSSDDRQLGHHYSTTVQRRAYTALLRVVHFFHPQRWGSSALALTLARVWFVQVELVALLHVSGDLPDETITGRVVHPLTVTDALAEWWRDDNLRTRTNLALWIANFLIRRTPRLGAAALWDLPLATITTTLSTWRQLADNPDWSRPATSRKK